MPSISFYFDQAVCVKSVEPVSHQPQHYAYQVQLTRQINAKS